MNKSYAEYEKLVKDNIGLVAHEANRYRHVCSDVSELESEGLLGLEYGARKYDKEHASNAAPRSYIRKCIRGYVINAMFKNRNVHIPPNRINQRIAFLANPDKNKEVKIPWELSMSYPKTDSGDDDMELNTEMIVASGASEFSRVHESAVAVMEDQQCIQLMMDTAELTEIERDVISYRFSPEEPMTLKAVASVTGYTAMGIKRVQDRAIKKMKATVVFQEISE